MNVNHEEEVMWKQRKTDHKQRQFISSQQNGERSGQGRFLAVMERNELFIRLLKLFMDGFDKIQIICISFHLHPKLVPFKNWI